MSLKLELLNEYCFLHSSDRSIVLDNIERDIALNTSDPSLASDYVQGRFLSLISKLIQPNKILEIGTFLAYSTICLAEGLLPDGKIDTIEVNNSFYDRIIANIELAGLSNKVEVHIGKAFSVLNELNLSSYDLYFIDAAKKEYIRYFEEIMLYAKSGAHILIDNVLWKGEVANNNTKGIAKVMQDFNQTIRSDDRVTNFILPLRDGINVITVK